MKFAGGREAAGILKGYDPLLNLVLDNTTEFLRGKIPNVIHLTLLNTKNRHGLVKSYYLNFLVVTSLLLL